MELTAVVHANWGRWVADCPRPGCANAEHYGAHVNGMTKLFGGLDDADFRCSSCGQKARAVWPERPLRHGVEQLLSDRPVPESRNWSPGETLHELLAESIEHGVIPSAALDGEGRLLGIEDGRIIDGASRRIAPTFAPVRALDAEALATSAAAVITGARPGITS